MKTDELYKLFSDIYNITYSNTFKYVICNISNLEDVDDLIQEIYFEFYKALIKNKKIDNYSSYIIGIAKKKINGHYKIFYKIRNFFSISNYNCDCLKDEYNLESNVFDKLELKRLIDYINSKDIVVARCIYLYYYLNIKIKDIAIELNISESSVKNNIYRTINEYRKLIEKE